MKKLFCLLFMFSVGLSVLSETTPSYAGKTLETVPALGCIEQDGPCNGPPP